MWQFNSFKTLANDLEEKFQFQTTKILALKHQGGGANVSSNPKKFRCFMKIKLILNFCRKNHFWKYYT
jgi:hypothetical protein